MWAIKVTARLSAAPFPDGQNDLRLQIRRQRWLILSTGLTEGGQLELGGWLAGGLGFEPRLAESESAKNSLLVVVYD
jgi:hypothetical protein